MEIDSNGDNFITYTYTDSELNSISSFELDISNYVTWENPPGNCPQNPQMIISTVETDINNLASLCNQLFESASVFKNEGDTKIIISPKLANIDGES